MGGERKELHTQLWLWLGQVKKCPSRLLPNKKLGFPMRIFEGGLSSFNIRFLGYIFTPSDQKILAQRKLCALPSPAGLHPLFSILQQLIHLPRILLTQPASVALWVSLCCLLVSREKLWCKARLPAPLSLEGQEGGFGLPPAPV